MIEMETKKYRLRGMTPLLGSQPANPEVRTAYLASRAPDPALGDAETAMLPEDKDAMGLTVFLRSPDDDALCVMDYVIRGYLKEALTALGAQNGIKQARSKVDKYLFAGPRVIPILRDGERIYDEDEQLERSLRAETMQGPRRALVASEMVYDPWEIEVELTLLSNAGSTKSKAITWDAIEQALDFGRLCGLGQWRNGGYGRFTWERVEK